MFGIDRIATTSKIIFDVVAVRSMLFAIHACVEGPSCSLAVPSKNKVHVGVRACAPMRQRCAARQLALRRSAGALAATRQQSYGCANGDVRWRSTSTTFNIITIITTYITEGVEMFMRLGGCVSFWLPKIGCTIRRWNGLKKNECIKD